MLTLDTLIMGMNFFPSVNVNIFAPPCPFQFERRMGREKVFNMLDTLLRHFPEVYMVKFTEIKNGITIS